MNFKEIYLLGDGKVAKECLKITECFFNKKVIYINLKEKIKLDEFFTSIKNTLIISANNFYIFKKSCVEQNFIINYHNSLLPKHKGCNAHIWSIWENDKKSGITWHKVDCGIDTGEIILQKEIQITEETTALKLLKKQHIIAIESLKECFNILKINNFSCEKSISYGGGYHKKCDLPNNGILYLSWEKEKINRFLRAMDNGNLTPKAKVFIKNKEIEIVCYKINETCIEIILNDDIILKI